jgi:acylphosphatase
VRNVGYDEVEAIAEGRREQVERFLELTEQGPRGAHVDETRVEWEDGTGEFAEFGVRRSI